MGAFSRCLDAYFGHIKEVFKVNIQNKHPANLCLFQDFLSYTYFMTTPMELSSCGTGHRQFFADSQITLRMVNLKSMI